jgi:hypothetical protein
MLETTLIILAVLTGIFLVIVAMQPADFRVTRTATLPSPVSAVFPHVNDFHNWEHWSPWAKLDPTAKNSFEGPDAGTGAIFRWEGNKQVGQGNMTITESRSNELIRIRLEFLKPFKAVNTAEFVFKPQGNETQVTWSMYGKNNFLAKAVNLFINCEKLVGPDFEKGLASMKSVVASTPGQ